MHELSATDKGRTIDWGKTSVDYAKYRSGPPSRFYQILQALGVGNPEQNILDLGTGTGLLACQFARQGARVAGIDLSANQIERAKKNAIAENLAVDFRCSPAEYTPFDDGTFDVITANQCWLYFDKEKIIPEIKRLLKPHGLLVTSHFSWLPRQDPVAQATEQLVLQHNPAWSASDWSGQIPNEPSWAKDHFNVQGMFWFDAPIGFSHESWRGRIRACRGVGAGLEGVAVEKFDADHQTLLERIVPNEFTVLHRIDAHLFKPKLVAGGW